MTKEQLINFETDIADCFNKCFVNKFILYYLYYYL